MLITCMLIICKVVSYTKSKKRAESIKKDINKKIAQKLKADMENNTSNLNLVSQPSSVEKINKNDGVVATIITPKV